MGYSIGIISKTVPVESAEDMISVVLFALAVLPVDALQTTAADSSSFMLISGVSAASEMCLSAESGGAFSERVSCRSAA